MRDIKFRAWDKANKTMIPWDLRMFDDSSPVTGYGGEFPTDDEEFVLMQYVGNNVWEHDIITFLPGDKSTDIRQTAVVYYCEERAGFCVKSAAWDCPVWFCRDCEVIGNIHDNPDLLG